MSMTKYVETSTASGYGPINTLSTNHKVLTIKNLGPETAYLNNVQSNANPGNVNSYPLGAGETLVIGVTNEQYWYGVHSPGCTLWVFEG